MAKQRKIKHYSSASIARRHRRRGALKLFLFLILLALLILVGYYIARTLEKMNEESSVTISSEPSFQPSKTETLPESSIPTPQPELEPEKTPTVYRAVTMPLANMASLSTVEEYLKTVDAATYNTVVLPLKDRMGTLYYQSEIPLAATCQAVSPEALELEALVSLVEKYEFIPAAQMYALQDDLASHASYGTSFLYQDQAATTWLDNSANRGGKSWLNPYMEKTQAYLNEVSGEISAAGFDAIFVYGCQYPNTANQRGMGYGSNSELSTFDALNNILVGIQQTAEEHETEIIPAFLGECYQPEQKPHIYTGSPNDFTFSMAAPIVGENLALLDQVTAEPEKQIPVVSAQTLEELQGRGYTQYLVP